MTSIPRCRAVKIALLFIFFLCAVCNSFAQITVSPAQTAGALAQKLAGQGVTILNPTLNCAAQANGFFKVGSSNLGLDSGIVLTTGRAATGGGSFGINGLSSYLASTDNGFPGDSMLNVLAGSTTVDACDLEFDVIPNGDTLKFQYVFSSEEYKNAVCGPYNDAFAFFISGPGISGAENIALVPGTHIPVTINTINNGIPGSTGNIDSCMVMGPGSPFTAYYIDNSSGTTLTHYGFTTVLQAIRAIVSCGTYHLKIVIADAGDPLYDSGVFLKAGSLQTSNFTVGALPPVVSDTGAVYCVKGCLPGRFRIATSEVSSAPQTIKYIIGGNAVNGVDYTTIADSVVILAAHAFADVIINGLPTPVSGTKIVKLYILSPYSCAATDNILDSASMFIYDTLHISIVTPDTTICGNDSVQLTVQGDSMLSYNWYPISALSNAAIQDPVAFPSANTIYQVTAALPGSSCPAKTAEINFHVKLTPDIELQTDTVVCFNTLLQLSGATTAGNTFYSYSWSGPAGFSSSLYNPVINNVSAVNAGTYTVLVRIDTNNCSAMATIGVAVNTPDTPVVAPQIFCLDKQASALVADGTGLLWYAGTDSIGTAIAPVIETNELAVYTYYVTQTIGECMSPKTAVNVAVKKCCDGDIGIPTAFTPNNDGLNDKFEPIMDYGYYVKDFYIFNRWGQVVYSGLPGVWDGNYNGVRAEMGTYYYNIHFGCILGGTVERKGDVTLIR